MTAHSAVAIDDNFSTGQTGIALRSADYETSGRVDQKLGFLVEQFTGQNFLDDFLDAEISDLFVLHVRRVLRGDDDVRDANRFAIFVLNRNLALGIGTQPFDLPRFCECASVRDRDDAQT